MYNDIFSQPERYVRIAYNNDPGIFEVDEDGVLVPFQELVSSGQIAYDNEILYSFFETYHVTPFWINCNMTWGWFDEETGQWTGAIGQVTFF